MVNYFPDRLSDHVVSQRTEFQLLWVGLEIRARQRKPTEWEKALNLKKCK